MTTIERLQHWYSNHCNGEWEHGFGVNIETIDNPGWSCTLSLAGTPFESHDFAPVNIERSENDWLMLSATPMEFKIHCGPKNLEESLTIFCDWAQI
jgi:hypothetical protein